MDKIKIKERLKTAGIILIGIIATSLILLLLYGLVIGRVQKTIVKYEALHYMENKYKEKFEIKQIFGADKIWKTSWGYELWMVPKNKPDKDYTSDMEVYVFKKNGKFHEGSYDSYYWIKLNYEIWKEYQGLLKIIFKEKYSFEVSLRDIDVYLENGETIRKKPTINDIKNGEIKKSKISIGIDVFNDFSSLTSRAQLIKKILLLIKELNNKNNIKHSIAIWTYNIKIDNSKIIGNKNNIFNNKNLKYRIEIFEPKDLINIKEPKDIEKYIIYNRGN